MNKKIFVIAVFVFSFLLMQNMAYALYGIFAAKKVINKMENGQQPTEKPTLHNGLQSFFDGIAKAYDEKNVEAISAKVKPQAVIDYLSGHKISIDEWKISAKKEFADTKSMRSVFKVESAELNGDIISAAYTETHDYTLHSDEGHQYQSVSFWQVSLVKTDNGLQITHLKELAEKTTRDNVPYNIEPTTPKI
jgi:hypothetical protein